MLLAQAVPEIGWMQYGGLGLAGLLIVVGIPWLLNYLATVNKQHTELISQANDQHAARVQSLIDDQKEERGVHSENLQTVCKTFTAEMKEERSACERRLENHRLNNERWLDQLKKEIVKSETQRSQS